MTTMPPVLDLAAARTLLEAQPFSRLLGARITAFGDGGATLEIDIRRNCTSRTASCTAVSSPTPRTTRSPSPPARCSARPC